MTCIKQLQIHCMEKSQTRLTGCQSRERPQLSPFYVSCCHFRQGQSIKRGILLLRCPYTHTYIYIHQHVRVCGYIYLYTYIYIHTQNLMYKNIYIYYYICVYTYIHINTPKYTHYHTNSTISTCKREEEKEQRNYGHPRGPPVAELECRACSPFSLMCLGKQQ